MLRPEMPHTLRVVYEAEPDGSAWNVSIPSVPDCFTYGRSIAEARRAIRECLGLFDEEQPVPAADVVFDEDIRLPRKVRSAVRRFARVRAKAEAVDAELDGTRRAAAMALAHDAGLSLRDAGELLGLSGERVRKVLQQPG
jgi:predicted RNase H-like HicB family nuclease